AVNAGSYTITAGGLSSDNYAISYVGGTLNVDRKALTVTAANATKTYDGVAFTGGAGVTYAGFVAGEDAGDLGGTLSYGGTAQGAVNAGSYTITAGGLSSGNYAISYVDGTLIVDRKALTVTAANAMKTYDGVAFNGGNGVTYAGFVAGEDAADLGGTLSYGGTAQGAVNAGNYTITAGGLSSGNYAISYVGGTLSVDRKSLTVTASDATKTYDGQYFTGGAGVTYTGFVAGEDAGDLGGTLSYGGTAQGAVNAGSYTITAGGRSSGNYAITYVAGALAVDRASLTVTAEDAERFESEGDPVFTARYDGFVAGEGSEVLMGSLVFETAADAGAAPGAYAIHASGLSAGNYDIAYVDGVLTIFPDPATELPDAGVIETITQNDVHRRFLARPLTPLAALPIDLGMLHIEIRGQPLLMNPYFRSLLQFGAAAAGSPMVGDAEGRRGWLQ
ncbi:MBG domain-containing protein, partial [Zavarzinia aquatilis]